MFENHFAQFSDSVCTIIGETVLPNAFPAPYFVPASSVDPSSSTFHKNVIVFVYKLIQNGLEGVLNFPVDHAIQVEGIAPLMPLSSQPIVFSFLSCLFWMYFLRQGSLLGPFILLYGVWGAPQSALKILRCLHTDSVGRDCGGLPQFLQVWAYNSWPFCRLVIFSASFSCCYDLGEGVLASLYVFRVA